MDTEERKELRRDRRRQKDKKVRRITWIVLVVLLAGIVVLKLCEVDFSHLGGSHSNATVISDRFPYTLDSSERVSVQKQGTKLAVLTAGSVTVLNPANGKEEFSAVHGYANPVTAVSNSYLVTYDQGGSKLRLDYNGENLYEIEAKNGILCADVSDDGKVAYAACSTEKRSDIQVLSKTRNEKIKYSLSYGFVSNIAIRADGRQVAFVAMNSKNAKLQPKLYLMRLKDTEPYASFDLPGTQVLDIAFRGSSLYVVGNSFLSVASGAHLQNVLKNDEIQTVAMGYTSNGDLVLAYSSYNNAAQNTVAHISATGKVKSSFTVTGTIKDLSVSGRRVSVLYTDKIVIYKLSDGQELYTVSCSDNVRSVTMMSSNLFIQRQSIIEKEETKS